MFNCPGKVCRHLPGYFFARSLGRTNSPSLFLCQEILLFAQKKKAADLSDQWPFSFVSLVKVAYISLDISLDNCTISV